MLISAKARTKAPKHQKPTKYPSLCKRKT